MLHFEEITNQNLQEVCLLQVREEQRPFVADNMLSLAEAFATRNEGHTALPFAIYDDDTLIGFVMLGYGTLGDEEEPEIAEGNYCLWRLMLDAAHQGKGYAKPILDWVTAYVRSFPCGPARYLWLSYEPENTHGREVYRRYGFRETGEFCGEEIVAVLELGNPQEDGRGAE